MAFKYARSAKLEKLLAILRDYSESDQILFGQQNAGHIGVSINAVDGSESDSVPMTQPKLSIVAGSYLINMNFG